VESQAFSAPTSDRSVSDRLPRVGVSIHWYTLAIVTSLLNGCTFGFIAWREGHGGLREWSFAWLAWALAAFALSLLGSPETHPLIKVSCGGLWVVSSTFFLRGAYRLVSRKTPRTWYAVGVGAVTISVALGVGPAGERGMLPLVLFQSVGLISTGALLISSARKRAGAWLCGGALIVLGLHLLDAPLLSKVPNAFLWGFLVAIALQMLTALGMLMLYYEESQHRLVSAQRELERTRRIEALGRIAGGVAHDFNNMLTVMQGNVELLRRHATEQTERSGSLDAIEETIERAGRLTSQLLAFGRRSVVKPQSINVKQIVSGTLEMLRRVIPDAIELRFVCSDTELCAALDQALLEQIVLNLVTNARDAITAPGSIVVHLRKRTEPRPELVLSVKDDGEGIDAGTIDRIFEPFYTSKEDRGGTGLGLPSVQGAVTQLGGTIQVTSSKGQGSTFEIRLPWVDWKPAPAPHASARPSGVKTQLLVLVVDDDAAVRRTTARTLAEGGHQAELAADGATALALARSKRYDVIISDLLMPGMGGLELMEEISNILPRATFVLTSGYPKDAHIDPNRVEFLQKPYKGEDLLRVLEARRSSTRLETALLG
jgi:signal transduction histidine kinase